MFTSVCTSVRVCTFMRVCQFYWGLTQQQGSFSKIFPFSSFQPQHVSQLFLVQLGDLDHSQIYKVENGRGNTGCRRRRKEEEGGGGRQGRRGLCVKWQYCITFQSGKKTKAGKIGKKIKKEGLCVCEVLLQRSTATTCAPESSQEHGGAK